jgi:hypothetical protein
MPMAINFTVNNFGDLILEFAINFNGWGRGLGVVREGVRVSGFEESHMEYVVNLIHGTREAESVCMSQDLLSDGEGSKLFVVQLL